MISEIQEFPFQGKEFLVRVKMFPPFRFPVPMQDEACFYYVTHGKANVYSPTGKIQLENEGLVLSCGNYLNEFLQSTDSDYCEAIAIHLYPEVIKSLYKESDLPDFLQKIDKIKHVEYELVDSREIVKSFIDSLLFYFKNPKMIDDDLLRLKAKELILILAKTNNIEIVKSIFDTIYVPEKYDFKKTIEAHLYNDLSITELALLCNLSISSFKRKFQKIFNNSPAKYIKIKKLEKAAKLLKATDLRISDIAFQCGFSDLSHFTRSFSNLYQMNPRKFRNN